MLLIKKTIKHPKAKEEERLIFHNKISEYRKAGYILEYLPAYCPDLNLIEHKWAQAKSIRRKYHCNIDQLFKDFCL